MARPGQTFSDNVGPPWTPLVWHVGPNALVAAAQADLWHTASQLGEVLNDPGAKGSIAGPNPSDSTERHEGSANVAQTGEALRSSASIPTPVGPGRNALWQSTVRQMHDVD